jgi:uroporphyrin-III C-methyltransferase
MRKGHVSLVGAGPGDPALLTRKAAIALRRADVVLFDALVDERVLALARRARRFYVGKRSGRHALTQQEIHAAMVGQARRGRRVVRLKGGDPFVFGRGGEEAQALEQAGISYDVVPGVSSAIAAPASAGIPVTHRDHASGFLVVSGHDRAVFRAAVGAIRPDGITLVVMMGFGRRVELANELLDAGWSAATPAAVVAEATLPTERAWRGTLGGLAGGEAAIDLAGPAVLVVGAVAALDLSGRATAAARTGAVGADVFEGDERIGAVSGARD